MKENLIQNKSFNFALEVISLYQILQKSKEYVLSKQLLRSATSIWANIEEAIAAQSKKDFIMKCTIASKEARETKYWLMLLQKSQLVKYDFSKEINSIEHIINIITKIVKTTSSSLKDK